VGIQQRYVRYNDLIETQCLSALERLKTTSNDISFYGRGRSLHLQETVAKTARFHTVLVFHNICPFHAKSASVVAFLACG